MRRLTLMIALGALLLATLLPPAPASAALSFEDPQLCINGKLLMVEPTTAGIDVWVRVGSQVDVDFDVTHCGGDPTLPVVAPNHVKHNLTAHWAELAVKTKKFTDVKVHWDGQTHILNSGINGWVYTATRVD